MPYGPAVQHPTDAQVRGIARRLVRAMRRPPSDNPSRRMCGQEYELPWVDEERVARAAMALLEADGRWRTE